jgi:hypothetical protein
VIETAAIDGDAEVVISSRLAAVRRWWCGLDAGQSKLSMAAVVDRKGFIFVCCGMDGFPGGLAPRPAGWDEFLD